MSPELSLLPVAHQQIRNNIGVTSGYLKQANLISKVVLNLVQCVKSQQPLLSSPHRDFGIQQNRIYGKREIRVYVFLNKGVHT